MLWSPLRRKVAPTATDGRSDIATETTTITNISMNTGPPIRMTDNGDLLTLSHWLSPVFPVGGYAYSHGLEAAVAAGDVTTCEDLAAWLRVVAERGSGVSDAVLLTSAIQPGADIDELNEWAAALSASSERWQETSEQGAAFVRAVNAVTGRDDVAVALPVAVGRAAATLSLAPKQVAALYLQAMVANLATGAVRHIPLGQNDGQRVIAELQTTILAVAGRATKMAPEDIRSAAFGADMAAMRHETQDVRIFRT